jgi:hypothetical protein
MTVEDTYEKLEKLIADGKGDLRIGYLKWFPLGHEFEEIDYFEDYTLENRRLGTSEKVIQAL